MTDDERCLWRMTPSQEGLYRRLQSALSAAQTRQRPLLLTGDVGVGKTFLAQRLAPSQAGYYNIARDFFPQLLADNALQAVTPEAVVRLVSSLAETCSSPYAVVDGFEPLVSMWAGQRPEKVSTFLYVLSRTIMERPLLVVVHTCPEHVPEGILRQVNKWWPADRRFALCLTQADIEVVARNLGLDPMRKIEVKKSLYELMAMKLERADE